jgi:hypothetical protein
MTTTSQELKKYLEAGNFYSHNPVNVKGGCDDVKEFTYAQNRDIYNAWGQFAREYASRDKSEDIGKHKVAQGLRYGKISLDKNSRGPEFFLEQPRAPGEAEALNYTEAKHEIIMYIFKKYNVRCMYDRGIEETLHLY